MKSLYVSPKPADIQIRRQQSVQTTYFFIKSASSITIIEIAVEDVAQLLSGNPSLVIAE
ncbi:hypothetical protein [Desulfosporosinus youngiae]|uniref:hypothetical protein n=1 Tax=Desulfosporosinus youngiae TaxID=339862 RepID=UPI0003157941|nr:hypothetical protein [Desulfosporosinus youngiae]